jgi:hypothetical protein
LADASEAEDAFRERASRAYLRPVSEVPTWLSAHSAKGPVSDGGECFEVSAGVPPAPALLCRAAQDRRGRTLERVYRLEEGRPTPVWSAVARVGRTQVDLVVDVEDEGATLVLADRVPCRCEDVYTQLCEKASMETKETFALHAAWPPCPRDPAWHMMRHTVGRRTAMSSHS